MSDDKKQVRDMQGDLVLELENLLSQFQLGGACAPIEDRREWEKLVESKSKTPEERQLSLELANFLDLLKYLDERGKKPGEQTVRALEELGNLPIPERIEHLREINRRLMERIQDAGPGAQLRQ